MMSDIIIVMIFTAFGFIMGMCTERWVNSGRH